MLFRIDNSDIERVFKRDRKQNSHEVRRFDNNDIIVKQCSKCDEWLAPEKFSKNRRVCKTCCKPPKKTESHRGYTHQVCKYDENDNPIEKLCSICNRWLSPENFSKSSRTKSKLQSKCKTCDNKQQLMRLYNLTESQFDALPEFCEVCGSTENLHIDHCHDTNIVRGRLCNTCNTALGMLGDGTNNNRILKLYEYIKEKQKGINEFR